MVVIDENGVAWTNETSQVAAVSTGGLICNRLPPLTEVRVVPKVLLCPTACPYGSGERVIAFEMVLH